VRVAVLLEHLRAVLVRHDTLYHMIKSVTICRMQAMEVGVLLNAHGEAVWERTIAHEAI